MNVRYQEMLTLEPPWKWLLVFIALGSVHRINGRSYPRGIFLEGQRSCCAKRPTGITLFKHVNLRKGLIVFQYTLSLLFIVVVSIGFTAIPIFAFI